MPTYDYQCRSCGTVTEVIHSMLEPGPSQCELCGGELRRVIYPAGIIFKGSGFYSNDSRPADTSSDGGTAKGGSRTSGGDSTAKPGPSESASSGASSGDAPKKETTKSDAPST